MVDSTLISGLATAGATLAVAVFATIGRRKNSNGNGNEKQAVSLTKQLMNDQRRDLDRGRRQITRLEETIAARDQMIDQLRAELDYAHGRIAELDGP